jgi:hypothetical protein
VDDSTGRIDRLSGWVVIMGKIGIGGVVAHSPPSRPGEFHPEPLTEPDMNLSIHPARATPERLPPCGKTMSSSGYPLTQSRRG